MKEFLDVIYDFIMVTIDYMGVYGPLLGSLLIVVESIIPVLPLFVFISINFIAFGPVLGFIISWLCTVIGCCLSYFLVKKLFGRLVVEKLSHRANIPKYLGYIENLSIQKITIILSVPFTPAFLINIVAGLANMDFKKFFAAIVISKIFLVYFWGVVGTSLVESFRNPSSLITVVVMMVSAYVLSYGIKKLFKID